MKKCDHCPREAIVTYDKDPEWVRERTCALASRLYVGGLCKDHDTEENRDVIVERWKHSS